MAVVTCPGCRCSVNDRADNCPRCGCSLAYVRKTVEKPKPQKTIKPQINVYVPIGDGTRDRGEKLHTLYFSDDGIKMGYQYNVVDSMTIDEITSVDCYRAANPRGSGAAGMAATGLLLGGLTGAVVGGIIGAADNASWYFEACTRDKTWTCRLPVESKKAQIIKWAEQHGLMQT